MHENILHLNGDDTLTAWFPYVLSLCLSCLERACSRLAAASFSSIEHSDSVFRKNIWSTNWKGILQIGHELSFSFIFIAQMEQQVKCLHGRSTESLKWTKLDKQIKIVVCMIDLFMCKQLVAIELTFNFKEKLHGPKALWNAITIFDWLFVNFTPVEKTWSKR